MRSRRSGNGQNNDNENISGTKIAIAAGMKIEAGSAVPCTKVGNLPYAQKLIISQQG